MARAKTVRTGHEFAIICRSSEQLNENNDCMIKAVALSCGVNYSHVALASYELGRKKGRGTPWDVCHALVNQFAPNGFTKWNVIHICQNLIQKYPGGHALGKWATTHQPERFASVWTEVAAGRNAILFSHAHASALVDGKVIDWAQGRSKRISQIWWIEK